MHDKVAVEGKLTGKSEKGVEQYLSELHASGIVLSETNDLTTTWGDRASSTQLPPVLTAPVEIPAREHLSVRLVPLDWLDRFEEYRGDESLYMTLAGTSAGGIIGFFTNVITGGSSLNASSWTFAALLSLITVFLVTRVISTRRRAERLKARMQALPARIDGEGRILTGQAKG